MVLGHFEGPAMAERARRNRILTPSGMLVYGFPVDHFQLGLRSASHPSPSFGSTDSAPRSAARAR